MSEVYILTFLYLVFNVENGISQKMPNTSTTSLTPTPLPPSLPTPSPTPPSVNTTEKPSGKNWPGDYGNNRTIFADWLLNGNWSRNARVASFREVEYEGYDGWYNNLGKPEQGAIDGALFRRWPASYKDGTYTPSGFDRPNPFDLSDMLLSGEIGTHSKDGKNALLVFFGQQIVEEILDSQRPSCPPEYFNIKIPKGHRFRNLSEIGHTVMPFLRTRYDQRTGTSPNNPRQQLNEITPFIDGGLFYGTTKQWADELRTYSNGTMDPNGKLASSEEGLFPEYNTRRLPMANPPPPFYHGHYIKAHETAEVKRFFKLGNPRGNENAFLLTFGILWFRWHNYLAERLKYHHKDWSGEKIFNEARKWTIATQQKIYVYEWLPKLLSDQLPTYNGYDPTVDPQIDQFFQSAAFRFGHTLVVPGVYLRDYIRNNCSHTFNEWGQSAIRTCNIFWRGQEPILTKLNSTGKFMDIDRILMGMSVQLSEQEDNVIVEDLRGNVFGPLEFPRRDLMAINIQRGRDHGLPDFNSARRAFGLDPYENFDDFSRKNPHLNRTLMHTLWELTGGDFNRIDVWVGGILETTTGPGELFKAIIKDQFRRIRDGDRFWFENKRNKLFLPDEVERIKQTSIYDIIMAVTKMDADDIPKSPFKVPKRSDDDDALILKCKLSRMSNGINRYSLPQLNQARLNETCKQGTSYDYFSGSEVSFILTFVGTGAVLIATIGAVFIMIKRKEAEAKLIERKKFETKRMTVQSSQGKLHPMYFVNEYVGPNEPLRKVIVLLRSDKKQIYLQSYFGVVLRAIDLSNIPKGVIKIILVYDEPTVILQCPQNYDLVLKFESSYLRDTFLSDFYKFLATDDKLEKELIKNFNWKAARRIIATKEFRQNRLEMFFRVAFAHAFKIKHSKWEMFKIGSYLAKDVIDTELTVKEFAESLSMPCDNIFVKKMFSLVDKDQNGFISFREFVDLIIIFAEDSEEGKAKLLFDMYDINTTGYLETQDFILMIKAFLETVGGNVSDKDIKHTITTMLERAGVSHKNKLDFQDFKSIMGKEITNLNHATLGFKGVKMDNPNFYLASARNTIQSIYQTTDEIEARFKGITTADPSKIIDEDQEQVSKKTENRQMLARNNQWNRLLKFIEIKSKEIFWLLLYTLVLLAIFAERAYYYSVEREHSGLRAIAGYGVTITRGAASAMMFTYSSLFVTMCRNMITHLRETVANRYFPFDSLVEIHKYISAWAAFFTVLHIIGHAFNFYHISTQPADDLTCLFRNFFHQTHVLPKFHYWCWQTLTGITGLMLTCLFIIMFVFAQSIVRRKLHKYFWYTHNLYPIFVILFILHGCGRLIQPPLAHYFLLGPIVLFTIDSLISISKRKIEIPVIKAEILPSNVTLLVIRKPENFQYKAGQWVRIACPELNRHEFHPFTLSSAPHEDNLTVHIRAIGPWTKNIRLIFDKDNRLEKILPRIRLDGPYGEGHQDWRNYDVTILIGGGIGVTPFASILKEVGFSAKKITMPCKKVYFIWVSRTQKQFEWLVDIIRDVESVDLENFLSCHIFITQFYEKFDMRTIFLYICEKHYQKIANKSLFTSLKAVTHFSRPAFPQFFKTVHNLHSSARTIGVFSCGPPSMTSAVNNACSQINSQNAEQRFEHQYKNF